MSTSRLVWVLLLAVLMPLRGALAVGWSCPMSSGPAKTLTQSQAQTMAMPTAHMAAGATCHDEAPPAAADERCPVCAAMCAAGVATLALPAHGPTLAQPGAGEATRFPELLTPPARHLPSGLERPPRRG